jgi:hypothetical protein
MADAQKLIGVLREVRDLLAIPDNDFLWSSWRDAGHALQELDNFLRRLSEGVSPDTLGMGILFAPTGPIQEVALSSGWGDTLLELADRFDAAMAAGETLPSESCSCFQSPGKGLITSRELGMDANFGEISMFSCAQCGQMWLKYLYEVEAFTGSGRWYLGAISPAGASLTVENAKTTLESLDWYFCGGSYYNGQISKTSGAIVL